MGPLSWLNAENLERMPTPLFGPWALGLQYVRYFCCLVLASSDGKLKIAESNPSVDHSCSKVVDLGQKLGYARFCCSVSDILTVAAFLS